MDVRNLMYSAISLMLGIPLQCQQRETVCMPSMSYIKPQHATLFWDAQQNACAVQVLCHISAICCGGKVCRYIILKITHFIQT